MIASPARTLASQTNGRKSKGPISLQGKMVSRTNSLKHGMTGAGVVLPDEDAAEVSRRFEELEDQFQPSTPMGKILVHRIALASVRLERSAEQEAAHLSEKVRHAKEDHDEERQIAVDALLDGLDNQPGLCVRKLLRTPEGIDALIREWDELRDNLEQPDPRCWTAAHRDRANSLMGRRRGHFSVSRVDALSAAIRGDFGLLGREGDGLIDDARRAWARDRLVELIDDEVATLRDCREGLDLEAFEQDREDAPRRALFDASKPAILARRYEAANERGMFRALKELRQVEEKAVEDPQPSPSCPVVPSGSFFPASVATIEPESESLEKLRTTSGSDPRTSPVGLAGDIGRFGELGGAGFDDSRKING